LTTFADAETDLFREIHLQNRFTVTCGWGRHWNKSTVFVYLHKCPRAHTQRSTTKT